MKKTETTTTAPRHAQPQAGLYDVKALSQLLQVTPDTIRSKRFRNQLPEPTAILNGGAVWDIATITAFLAPNSQESSGLLQQHPQTFSSSLSVVDLFSGCGGLSLGFQKAGYDVKAGFDNWESAVEVYNDNLGHEAFVLDLSDVGSTIETLTPWMENTNGIIGGPPCQDFSSAGKRIESKQADLTEKYAEVVNHFAPEFFVMENVPLALKSAAFARAIDALSGRGYGITTKVMDASRTGVPQKRHRLFTIGVLNQTNNLFSEALERGLSAKPMTMREYFGDELEIEHYYRHPRSYARRGIFSIDEPSPTVRGVNRPIPSGYVGHPGDTAHYSEARPLTTAERARVQTFPKDFKLSGVKTHDEQMIGNAVPVELARYVASSIREIIENL